MGERGCKSRGGYSRRMREVLDEILTTSSIGGSRGVLRLTASCLRNIAVSMRKKKRKRESHSCKPPMYVDVEDAARVPAMTDASLLDFRIRGS